MVSVGVKHHVYFTCVFTSMCMLERKRSLYAFLSALCARVCVCTRARACVYVSVCARARARARARVCVCKCVCVCVCVCV